MHRPDDGVSSLAAGSFASAAITGSGDLHLWGTLLSQDVATAIQKSSGRARRCCRRRAAAAGFAFVELVSMADKHRAAAPCQACLSAVKIRAWALSA